MNKKNLKNIAVASLFTAMIAVISQIYFVLPSGVPLTMQVFAVALCGYILGAKWCAASIVVYILAGMVGLPVFSGFRGGAQHLFGATGGFIIGFILLGLFCGFSFKVSKITIKFFFGFIGLIFCYSFGVIQFSLVSGIGLAESFVATSAPFIIKDVILLLLSLFASEKFKKSIKKAISK